MSEHDLTALIFKDNLEKHPEAFRIDMTQVEAKGAELREWDAKNNPPKPEPARIEYNRLRQQLWQLKQDATNAEVRVNHEAGNIREWEKQINTLLVLKKKAHDAVQLADERAAERQLVQVEADVADAKIRYEQRKKEFAQAVRTLKGFNHSRLKDLEKELGL